MASNSYTWIGQSRKPIEAKDLPNKKRKRKRIPPKVNERIQQRRAEEKRAREKEQ